MLNNQNNNLTFKPKPRKEEQEFGPGKAGVLKCPECGVFYYNKSWHHQVKEQDSGKPQKFYLCPSCQMIKDNRFEGQLILKNIAVDKKQEIINLIKNIGVRAFSRDPLDRIIKIEEREGEIEVLLTENQITSGMAKQIRDAFGGKMEIKWSHEENVVRIILEL